MVGTDQEENDSMLQARTPDVGTGICFLGMYLTPGTTRLNIAAMLLSYLGMFIFLNMKTAGIGYLLQADFDVTQQDTGKVVGSINSISTIAQLCASFFLGTLMDVIGRRIPISTGMIGSASMLILMTFVQDVYPGVVVCVTILTLGGAPLE